MAFESCLFRQDGMEELLGMAQRFSANSVTKRKPLALKWLNTRILLNYWWIGALIVASVSRLRYSA
jgi:hypothetical protein